MVQNRKLTNNQLISFSREHLYYELNMLLGVSNKIKESANDQYIYSALLESFIIHATLILDFFYKPPRKSDDASVNHYVDDLKKWKKMRPSYDRYFRKFYRRRSREVVHLSYKRLDIKKEDKKWEMDKIIISIGRLLSIFLKLANPKLIHPQLFELDVLYKEINHGIKSKMS